MIANQLVTIFIVTYNRAYYLNDCIESILNQTYREFNLIILDNASTDNTIDVVNKFKDERIRYIKHPENIGGISNINYAMQICETKYYIIFHDDDIMEPNLIEKELEEMEKHEEYAIVSSLASTINSNGDAIKTKSVFNEKDCKKTSYQNNEYLLRFLTEGADIYCPSVMYRNSFFKENNLFFRNNVGPAADQYLWFDVENLGGVICCINKTLMKYRLHEFQDSNLNSLTMSVDLYRVLNNSESYKLSLLNYKSYTEKRFLKIVICMGKKISNNEITLDWYTKYTDIILNEICNTKLIALTVKLTKYFVIRFPNAYAFVFDSFKRLIVNRREKCLEK